MLSQSDAVILQELVTYFVASVCSGAVFLYVTYNLVQITLESRLFRKKKSENI